LIVHAADLAVSPIAGGQRVSSIIYSAGQGGATNVGVELNRGSALAPVNRIGSTAKSSLPAGAGAQISVDVLGQGGCDVTIIADRAGAIPGPHTNNLAGISICGRWQYTYLPLIRG
jgi:hypothetical protein